MKTIERAPTRFGRSPLAAVAGPVMGVTALLWILAIPACSGSNGPANTGPDPQPETPDLADPPPDGAAAIDALLAEQGAVGAIAQPLFTDYVLAFELTESNSALGLTLLVDGEARKECVGELACPLIV